jgi:hypothetical protein
LASYSEASEWKKEQSPEVIEQANLVWDFLRINDSLRPADVTVVLSCYDEEVNGVATSLVAGDAEEKYGKYVVASGGYGRLSEVDHMTEARQFYEQAIAHGISPERIKLEESSTNTGENLMFTRDQLLHDLNLDPETVLLVTPPFQAQRAKAAGQLLWPGRDFVMVSPDIPLMEYRRHKISRSDLIANVLGEVRRLTNPEYIGKYQAEVEVPSEILDSYEFLRNEGY